MADAVDAIAFDNRSGPMKLIACSVFVSAGVGPGRGWLVSAQEPKWKSTKPINDLPNPASATPNGPSCRQGSKWGAVIGAEPGPDGNIYVVHRCFENSCAGRTEPPIFKFDRAGKVLKSWGVGAFIFPHGLHVDERQRVGDRRAGARRQGPPGVQA
jgi:hypothetical protein